MMNTVKMYRENSGVRKIFQDISGNPLRITLLIASDLLWSFLVLFFCCRLYCALVTESGCPAGLLQDCRNISIVIVIINLFAKCYHGDVLNPGAAINRVEEIRRLTLSVAGAYFLGYLLRRFLGAGSGCPPIPFLFSLAVTAVGFPAMRFLIRLIMKKTKTGQIRVFLAGGGKTAQTVAQEVMVSAYYGYEIIGFFDDDTSKQTLGLDGIPRLGRIGDAPRLAKQYNVHSIICCLPPVILPRITKSYTKIFKHVLIIPSNDVLPITAVYPTLIGFVSGFECQNRVLFLIPRIIKRLAEVVMAGVCVVLLLPLFAVLALLVKLSGPGPVFYTAKRLGQGGREIKVFKFRTMYQNAEARLETLLEENPEMKREWEAKFKLKDDPRITRIGRLLRKSSLDELPQFINVLRGEMALIGPRPIVPDEIKYYGDAYDFLQRVRPGITGLWQVSGRSSIDYKRRVMLDMFYVMNWSVWLDWYIFCKTVLGIAMCRGSY